MDSINYAEVSEFLAREALRYEQVAKAIVAINAAGGIQSAADAAQAQNVSTRAELEQAQGELATAKQAIDAARTEAAGIISAATEQAAGITKQAEVDSATAQAVADLATARDERDGLSKEIVALRGTAETLTATRDDLTSQVADLESKLASVKAAIAALKG